MPESLDRTAAKAAVRALLRAIPNTGTVADWMGQGPDRDREGHPQRLTWPYWEVSFREVVRDLNAASLLREQVMVRLEGWFPVFPPSSEVVWDTMLSLIVDTLTLHRALDYPNLGDADPVQETEGELVSYNTRSETVLCHHVVFTVPADHCFTFETL